MSLEQLLAWIPPGSPDETLARQVNFEQLPAHIAIIMDGNGRWAAQRHLPRVEGHRAGIDSVRDVVETSARLGIDVLTLYAFSVENWKRPRAEVNTLMTLLKRYIRLELGTLLKNNITFRVIGRAEELAPDVQDELELGIRQTASNTGMLFNIALNYGGRAEIVDAARRAIAAGLRPDDLDERRFAGFLYTAGQPDPDLLIRTSGEMRISNFLLWQIAYSEIWVTDTLWPDFRRRHLLEAVVAYQKRDRRYGGIKPSPVAIAAGTVTLLASIGVTSTRWVGDVLAGTAIALDAILMSAVVLLAALTLVSWRGDRDALGRASAAIFPALYLGLPIGAMVSLRALRGREVLFLLLLTVMVSDTAQYYTGRAFGRRLLAPAISPKKTIEGAIGGLVFGAAILMIVGAWWLPLMPLALRGLLGVALVALGIGGDLFESMLKRSAGVKDSSTLIPGHGGVLDRIDALLFAAPIYYVVLKYV